MEGNPSQAVTFPNGTLDGYKIIGRIGRGATCSVYEAVFRPGDGMGHDHVAIKVFDPLDARYNVAELKEIFLFEAQTLQSLDYELIPKVHRICDGDPCYYVMDCIAGPSGGIRNLREIQRSHTESDPDFTEENVTSWFIDVARTLSYLHGNENVLHCDINPANIVVDANGRAFLIDYGSSRTNDRHRLELQKFVERIYGKHLTGFIMGGTPGYMPPEAGNRLLTPASDVYSLGATFWELLFNEQFDPLADDAGELMNDDSHRGIIGDPRWMLVLPRMLLAKPKDRITIEECLSIFTRNDNAKDGATMKNARIDSDKIKGSMFDAQYRELLGDMTEYSDLLHSLNWVDEGRQYSDELVISAIYNKYRHEELRDLKTIYESNDAAKAKKARDAIIIQDDAFMKDFMSAGLKVLADKLFANLNALWAVSIDDNGCFSDTAKDYIEQKVAFIRRFLSYQAQFTFGRYRHIRWGLDSGSFFSDRHHSANYRGERAADRLFIYERTIAAYNPEPDIVVLHLDYLKGRNMRENLRPDEILDFAKIWGVDS